MVNVPAFPLSTKLKLLNVSPASNPKVITAELGEGPGMFIEPSLLKVESGLISSSAVPNTLIVPSFVMSPVLCISRLSPEPPAFSV